MTTSSAVGPQVAGSDNNAGLVGTVLAIVREGGLAGLYTGLLAEYVKVDPPPSPRSPQPALSCRQTCSPNPPPIQMIL